MTFIATVDGAIMSNPLHLFSAEGKKLLMAYLGLWASILLFSAGTANGLRCYQGENETSLSECTTDKTACAIIIQVEDLQTDPIIMRDCIKLSSFCHIHTFTNNEGFLYQFFGCCLTDLCNLMPQESYFTDDYSDYLAESTRQPVSSTPTARTSNHTVVAIGTSVAALLLVLLVLTICAAGFAVCVARKRGPPADQVVDLSFDELSSGRGEGHMLEQKTISRQVKLNVQIGRGRYGEVWVGKWFDKEVAVKKFAFCDKESWTREREIYETDMLRNEYILTYLAADMYEREFSSCLEMWMVTDFHEHGSLFDYLNQYSLSEYHMIKFARTTASGLAFLHMDLRTRDSVKPCIAHRDIKSRNILVKSDLACCIADFGLAVRHDTVKNLIDIAPNSKQGTKRYMSPEVLGETINIDDFTSFKNSDIYSLGLVLWEILRRCLVDGECLEYQLPYHERVPGDPSIAEMKTLVVDEKYRPEIKKRWVDSSEACSAMASIIEECWSPLPEARLNARRVEKNFSDVDVKRPPYS